MKSTEKTQEKNGKEKSSTKKVNQSAEGLKELFVDELKDIYYAEKALTKAIPKMIRNSTSTLLVDALTGHLETTKAHVKRLEDVFETIGEKATAKKCEAMVGLLKEAEEIMDETEDGVIRDAGIISAGQKVEHYEIATYSTLHAFAQSLGEMDAAEMLMETLDEEKIASEKLAEVYETLQLEIGNYEIGNYYEEEENSDATKTMVRKKQRSI